MSRILIIGIGAAGSVVAKKCARLTTIFTDIHLANRTITKCEKIQREVPGRFTIHQLDANNVQDTVALIRKIQPKLVINMALPYQDLPIMDACLETGVHYLDTACYEPIDEARYSHTWQWAYHDRFKDRGIMAVLGSGFDPGVTNMYVAYAKKHLFDTLETIDIVDCNGGDHGQAFATNFNPEINIREITQRGKYWENGKWIETDPLSVCKDMDFPEVGVRKAYLMYHEEEESLVKHFPEIKRIRFWMTFGQEYLTHLRVMKNIGITRIDPVMHNGVEIVPIQFLKTILPEPSSLGENYTGKTCIGCVIEGIKNGERKKIFIYNVCDHEDSFKDVGSQAISYTTGVPAAVSAALICQGVWTGKGVFNMEQLNPDPFLDMVADQGLPWRVVEDPAWELA